mmetsp:Transcript_18232/g.41997  ORF Transcript_18232/g.41997 Transcript_18232/m.41997 type:complete len:94 (-) Transcript_18232:27-308(-)
MTALEVKFSEAINSRDRHWRFFSCSIKSYNSGSWSARETSPLNSWSLKEVIVNILFENELDGRESCESLRRVRRGYVQTVAVVFLLIRINVQS